MASSLLSACSKRRASVWTSAGRDNPRARSGSACSIFCCKTRSIHGCRAVFDLRRNLNTGTPDFGRRRIPGGRALCHSRARPSGEARGTTDNQSYAIEYPQVRRSPAQRPGAALISQSGDYSPACRTPVQATSAPPSSVRKNMKTHAPSAAVTCPRRTGWSCRPRSCTARSSPKVSMPFRRVWRSRRA